MIVGECNFENSITKGEGFIKNENVYIKGNGYETKINGSSYGVILLGNVYNASDIQQHVNFIGSSPRNINELILLSYYAKGTEFIQKLRGNFCIVIYDGKNKRLLLVRDHLGVWPLFYKYTEDRGIMFSSDLGTLASSNKENIVTKIGLCEIFGIGPAKTIGTTVFKDINEVMPGHIATFEENEVTQMGYFKLTSSLHKDDIQNTVNNVRNMVIHSVTSAITKDTCSLLSGGIDSTVVTAIVANHIKNEYGKKLNTFSFDYKNNDKYFTSNSFQPQEDAPYVKMAVDAIGTNHTYLQIDTDDLINNLYECVVAKGLPGMGDIDSSLLSFLKKVKLSNSQFFTGEGADEVLGGYPWFNRQELINVKGFPWSYDINVREDILHDDIKTTLNVRGYVNEMYEYSLKIVPLLQGEEKSEENLRKIYYLCTQWFMPTLVARTQRISAYIGITPHMPYGDVDLLQYAYNIPWSIKLKNGTPKYTLRQAFADLLPKQLVNRKKSPFPKTYNPAYTKSLKNLIKEEVLNKNAPIYPLLNEVVISNILLEEDNVNDSPWFGQLMKRPQQLAYILQINYWLKKYNINLKV